MELLIVPEQSKEEGKGKESIQLSNTHDPGHGMVWESDKNNKKHHIQGSQEVSPFPTGDHKAARNRHGRQDTLNPATCQFDPRKSHPDTT